MDKNEVHMIENISEEDRFEYSVSDMDYKLRENLINTRKTKGYTKEDISKRSGLTREEIDSLERFGGHTTLSKLISYVIALDADIDVVKVVNDK